MLQGGVLAFSGGLIHDCQDSFLPRDSTIFWKKNFAYVKNVADIRSKNVISVKKNKKHKNSKINKKTLVSYMTSLFPKTLATQFIYLA